MAPPLIQLKDIRLTFGGTPLLTGVELSVSPDERVCLIGRNGSGKSTLLKIAAGLVEARQRQPFCSTGFDHPLSAAGAGFRRPRHHARLCRGGARSGRRPLCRALSAGATRAARRRRPGTISPAARPAARRWRGCWRPRPTSCCWTSRPTISISPPSNGWKRELDSRRSALVLISHDRRFLENLSRATAWLDRGQIRQIDRGFAAFEAWRDEVLAEEEREQHKLDRKIVNEEHWLRYGVSGRRKRNVKRLGQSPCAAAARRDYRGAAGDAKLAAAEAEKSGTAGDRGQGHRQVLWRAQDRREFLDPHPARRPHRHCRAERRRQDHAGQSADRRGRARQRQRAARAPISRWRRWTSTAKASIPNRPWRKP